MPLSRNCSSLELLSRNCFLERSTTVDPMNLSFVAGQIRVEYAAINDEIARLPDEVHLTGVASSEGPTTYNRSKALTANPSHPDGCL